MVTIPPLTPLLPGKPDFEQPVAGVLVEAGCGHGGEHVLAVERLDHLVSGTAGHSPVGQRGPHHGQIGHAHQERALPGVDVGGLVGIGIEPAVTLEQVGDALVRRLVADSEA